MYIADYKMITMFTLFSYNKIIFLTLDTVLEIMVSVQDSRSKGLGSSPGQGICVVSRARHFTLTVPLST